VQQQHFGAKSAFDFDCQRSGFETRVDGVASPRVAELKVEHVARLLADAGARQAHARWGESA
jgi:hypothetical protein